MLEFQSGSDNEPEIGKEGSSTSEDGVTAKINPDDKFAVKLRRGVFIRGALNKTLRKERYNDEDIDLDRLGSTATPLNFSKATATPLKYSKDQEKPWWKSA